MPESSAPIRILVVDDHPILREGIAAIIQNQRDMLLVGEACDGREALDQFRALRPDVTLMDLQMPVMNGVDAIVAIRSEAPSARFLVLTTYAGDAQAVKAMRAGATGYLLKSSLRTEMLDAIRNIHAGRRHIHHDVADEIARHVVDETLSEREVSILRLVAQGHGNRQIAASLGLSEETIKAHLKSTYAKLDAADRTHAVTLAIKRGFITL